VEFEPPTFKCEGMLQKIALSGGAYREKNISSFPRGGE